tara:strand:- start:696 stop:938 length:243 start_codon:yes stop_codon:yes gene_type:complete
MNDTGKIILALTVGFAAGAIATVLIDREMDDETKEKIKSKANELGDDLKKHYEDEIASLKNKLNSLTEEFKQATHMKTEE